MAGQDGVAPEVPGYRTGRLLGFGATGEVWSAVAADGEPVALKVLRGAPGDEARLRREAEALRRVQHPHVVRLREVVDGARCGPVLVLGRALGGSLAALVGARGPLDVGEVVTVLAPLAGALADLHARGVVHGDVSPGNVLFDEDGRPLLADLGVAAVVGQGPGNTGYGTPGYADPARRAGQPAGPESDVHGLAAVGWLALTGRPPPPAHERPPLVTVVPELPAGLGAVLEEALDVDARRRPSARSLAARCFAGVPAEPVRLVPTDPAAAPAEVVTHRLRAAAAGGRGARTGLPPGSAGRGRGRHRARPRWPSVAVAAALAALAVGAGWTAAPRLLGDGGPAAAAVTRTAQPAPVVPAAVEAALDGDDPEAAVPALAWLRARALTGDDPRFLHRAAVAGSPALDADLDVLAALRARGSTLAGLGFDVRRTSLVTRRGDVAVVDATVVTSRHREVTGSGTVLREVPEDGERLSRLVLRRGSGGWQVDRFG